MTPVLILAALASAFNLECSGTAYHVDKLMGPQTNVHPFTITYRVDLTTNRYCQNACTVTAELAKVTATMIIFEMEERDKLDDTIVDVNRESGKYLDRRRFFIPPDTLSIDMANGECRRAPFTGFPLRKF